MVMPAIVRDGAGVAAHTHPAEQNKSAPNTVFMLPSNG